MSNEFEKLDQLVKRNTPETTGALKPLTLPNTKSFWLKGLALSASLILVVTINQNRRVQEKTENLDALHEVMLWDMDVEEPVSEVDEVIELVE